MYVVRSHPNLDAKSHTVDVFCVRLDLRLPACFCFLKRFFPQAVGPLFPTKRYTLLNSMGISVGCYMAIVIVTTVLIFPETMSHAALDTVAGQLARVAQLIQMQDAVLEARPKESSRDGTLIQKFKGLRALVIGTQQQRASF